MKKEKVNTATASTNSNSNRQDKDTNYLLYLAIFLLFIRFLMGGV